MPCTYNLQKLQEPTTEQTAEESHLDLKKNVLQTKPEPNADEFQ